MSWRPRHRNPLVGPHLAALGQMAGSPVGQEPTAFAACRGRPSDGFGGGVRAHDAGERRIGEPLHGAMPGNGRGLHSPAATRAHLAQGLVEGQGPAVLHDHRVACAPGGARWQPQPLQGHRAQEVAQGGAEQRAPAGFGARILAGFVAHLQVP